MQEEQDKKNQQSQQNFFIIQHLQSEFSDWCKWEYIQIIYALNDKFSKTHMTRADCKTKILLMNVPDWKNQTANEQFKKQREETLKNWEQFISFNNQNNNVFIPTQLSLNQYLKSRVKGDQAFKQDWEDVLQKKDQSNQCYKLNSMSLSQLCFMDMRAEKKLVPQDSNNFKAYVFGGILGDDPPQDRAAHLRCNYNLPIRQLGKEQMTTDTAINVVKIVIQDCKQLDQIDFVNHPDIPTGEGVDKSTNQSNSQLKPFNCAQLDETEEGEYSSLNFKFVVNPNGANFVFNKRKVINYPLIHPGIHDILNEDKFDFNQLV